ncbi:hypothetical protein YM3MPS_53340 [Mycobacterium pseudoshottsii]|nr:hypothetical protein DL240490_00790 [Mycobacterium marinum]BEH79531.1 hypothetical protein YM3MPS_53340 [Mycobacterium pseudoshottsii]
MWHRSARVAWFTVDPVIGRRATRARPDEASEPTAAALAADDTEPAVTTVAAVAAEAA